MKPSPIPEYNCYTHSHTHTLAKRDWMNTVSEFLTEVPETNHVSRECSFLQLCCTYDLLMHVMLFLGNVVFCSYAVLTIY